MSDEQICLYNSDCIEGMRSIPSHSVDLIFADPPYNLSDAAKMTVQSGKRVVCNKGDWDVFKTPNSFLRFNKSWMLQCRRILKPSGTIWVSGTYHVYPYIGVVFHRYFYIVNDIIWYKPNATPLLAANRLAQKCELLLVATPRKGHFYFDYQYGKSLNNGKQLTNMWEIPAEPHITSNPCEKPEELLERVILLGSKPNALILDPFLGGGTTGVVAKRFGRKFIGYEKDEEMFEEARHRIMTTPHIASLEGLKKLKQPRLTSFLV